MSYELYFKPRNGSLIEDHFHRYFLDRPHCKCEESQAWYDNEDTGVYFQFEFQTTQSIEDDIDESIEHFPVALHVNYLRPSYFIIEVEREVSAFVQHFDLLVSDSQVNGMGEGEYNAEKLLSGWSSGNEFGYTSILRNENNRGGIAHLPAEQLHNAWRWNWLRSQVQADLGDSKFVPRIMFINLGGITVTSTIWPDGIPVVVTPVDYLCIPRKELALRKFFRKKEDITFVAWDKALPVLLAHGTQRIDGSISLNYTTPPPDVVKFVQSLPVEKRPITRLSPDMVLDRDIYERSID